MRITLHNSLLTITETGEEIRIDSPNNLRVQRIPYRLDESYILYSRHFEITVENTHKMMMMMDLSNADTISSIEV